MKLTLTIPRMRPRNPLVATSRLRVAGVHRRSGGGERQRAKRDLQRQIG